MSGGKGGSSTQTVEIPEYIEEAAKRNLTKAEGISQLGYVPYYGPDVAAFTPMQQAGFQNTADVSSAFGMAAPTSQRDIMGGMGEPTEYAGGVRGYSSQPMYQQSLDQFAAARPAQKSYMDSFFIDPNSGQYAYQPFDYTQMSSVDDAVAKALAERDAADEAYRVSQYSPSFDMDGMGGGVGGQPSPGDGNLSDANASGFGPGGTGMESQNTGGYTGLSDMFDGGGPGRSGDTFEGTLGGISNSLGATPAPVSDETENDPGGGDGDGDGDAGTVICTALHDLGILPDDIYNLDVEFGQRVNGEDPALGNGYRAWATPVAEYIKGNSLGSKVVRAVVAPIAKSWAAQMAHVMRPEEYKSNICGRLIMAVGHPICRLIGKFLTAKTKEA
jgi:hypothetical protein